jgi:hypothetical protein
MSNECRIGLVMAGAVSAGAYTAGVIDFLVQALDEWERARSTDAAGTPAHRVTISVLSGASAGGMTAAMLAGILAGRRHVPVTGADPGLTVNDNVLFQSWVNDIDIVALLGTADLADEAPLRSLLDSSPLDRIAQGALPLNVAGQRQAYADEYLELLLTLSNLRGVPYNLPFANDGAAERPGHGLHQHQDYLHFRFGNQTLPDLRRPLDWAMQGPEWNVLRQGALATGAFPVGLAARRIEQPGPIYNARTFDAPGTGKLINGQCDCHANKAIPPAWGVGASAPQDYAFVSVDGGVFNNEPFELARRALANGGRNERDPVLADRIMLAIDPFPDVTDFPSETAAYRDPDDLFAVVKALIGAFVNQSRFKPGELVLATTAPSASRRLIAPDRNGAAPDEPQLASGPLGGFAGFLDRRLRYHDFMLGRANCQGFLRDHFHLPAQNAIFAGNGAAQAAPVGAMLPVIPLLGSANAPIAVPSWPKIPKAELDRIEALIAKRVAKVLPHLLATLNVSRLVAFLIHMIKSRGWVKRIRNTIQQQLQLARLIA